MPGDLCQRWIDCTARGTYSFTLIHSACADHQYPVRTQMQGRRDRGNLAHGAITEIFTIDACCRENKRNGGGRHQMIAVDLIAATNSSCPFPWHQPRYALIKADRLPGVIA